MKVTHGREGKPSKQNTTVTGEMWGDALLTGENIAVNTVFFAPGARTHWHLHTGEQVLLITQGKGYVQTADGETARVTVGDIVFCPPNETHWHGAAEDSIMQHTTITIGTTEWLQPVPDDHYHQADQA